MITHIVMDLNDSLAERKLRIAALTGDDESAAEEFIKAAFLRRDHSVGAKYGLNYAEEFHYIGPDSSLDAYISQRAVPL